MLPCIQQATAHSTSHRTFNKPPYIQQALVAILPQILGFPTFTAYFQSTFFRVVNPAMPRSGYSDKRKFEKRRARDGHWYTFAEFRAWYGEERGQWEWEQASTGCQPSNAAQSEAASSHSTNPWEPLYSHEVPTEAPGCQPRNAAQSEAASSHSTRPWEPGYGGSGWQPSNAAFPSHSSSDSGGMNEEFSPTVRNAIALAAAAEYMRAPPGEDDAISDAWQGAFDDAHRMGLRGDQRRDYAREASRMVALRFAQLRRSRWEAAVGLAGGVVNPSCKVFPWFKSARRISIKRNEHHKDPI